MLHAGEIVNLKKGAWTDEEDAILQQYVKQYGAKHWHLVQKTSGLARCGKSCRLRYDNHLRPDLKKGPLSDEEGKKVVELQAKLGNKWSQFAAQVIFDSLIFNI